MNVKEALYLLEEVAESHYDLYPGLQRAVNVIEQALKVAQDFYALAEKFAKADDEVWALIRAAQWTDSETAIAAYEARHAAKQALILQLRTRKEN